jgi:methionyl-tRNA synthetase
MYEKGKFTEEISEQYYDEQAGEFLARQIYCRNLP